MNIPITGAHALYNYFQGPNREHKMHKFVEQLEKLMNDPKSTLTDEQKTEIAEKIATIEAAAKGKENYENCVKVALAISRTVAGAIGGTAGVAVEAYVTSDQRTKRKEGVVHEAEWKAGRRVASKNKSRGNKKNAAAFAAQTVLSREATKTASEAVTPVITSAGLSAWHWVCNLFG